MQFNIKRKIEETYVLTTFTQKNLIFRMCLIQKNDEENENKINENRRHTVRKIATDRRVIFLLIVSKANII